MLILPSLAHSSAFYSPSRNLTPPLTAGSSSSMLHLARLKRSSGFAPPSGSGAGGNGSSSAISSSGVLSATSCTFSCYLVVLGRLVCYAQNHMFEFKHAPRTTIQQLIEEYGSSVDDHDATTPASPEPGEGRLDVRAIENALENMIFDHRDDKLPPNGGGGGSSKSADSGGTSIKGRDADSGGVSVEVIAPGGYDSTSDKIVRSPLKSPSQRRKNSRENSFNSTSMSTTLLTAAGGGGGPNHDDSDLVESAKLGLKVALEALNCLSRLDEPADDALYRALAEACGCCGFAQE